MNTIAVPNRHVPRLVVIGIGALVAVFAVLMLVRLDVIGGSSSSANAPAKTKAPARTRTTPAKPKIVLLPGLPQPVDRALRKSKVVVVSLYTKTASGDFAAVAEARNGARAVGAGFVAVNVLDDKQARAMSRFAGPAGSPAALVVRRPGKVTTQFDGYVDSKIVAQAAHNAGARRR